MRLESIDGYSVRIVDGDENVVFLTDTSGNVTLPATTASTLTIGTTPMANVMVKYTDVTVTPAQVKALNATPKELVPAPGAGYANILEGAVLFFDYTTEKYDGIASGEDLSIRYTGTSGTELAQCETTSFLDQTSDQTRYVYPYRAASAISSVTPTEDAALVLHMLVGEIGATTGLSPLKVRTYYRVVPTTL